MSDLNKAMLIGRLGKDPEIRYTKDEKAWANARIATNETWKDKNGEKQEATEWHNLVFYGNIAEVLGKYAKKGSKLYIEGKLRTNKWKDAEGAERQTIQIVVSNMQLLDSKIEPTADVLNNLPKELEPVFDETEDDVPF